MGIAGPEVRKRGGPSRDLVGPKALEARLSFDEPPRIHQFRPNIGQQLRSSPGSPKAIFRNIEVSLPSRASKGPPRLVLSTGSTKCCQPDAPRRPTLPDSRRTQAEPLVLLRLRAQLAGLHARARTATTTPCPRRAERSSMLKAGDGVRLRERLAAKCLRHPLPHQGNASGATITWDPHWGGWDCDGGGPVHLRRRGAHQPPFIPTI